MAPTQQPACAEALLIEGDFEPARGPLEAAVDVTIQGAVRAGSAVHSSGQVTIGGAVEGAVVSAGADVSIEGGVAGGGAGGITAGGSLTARFCDDADLKAGGDIRITAGGVVHSRIETKGHFYAEQGALVGGQLYAREGATVKALGNESQVCTRVAVGMHPDVLAAGQRLEKSQRKQRESVQRIREMVQPLLANIRRLTPELREKATELMYQADGIEAQIQQEARKQAETLAEYTPTGEAALTVAERLHAGTLLIFGDRYVALSQDRQGPLRLVSRSVRGRSEIVLEELETSTVLTLVSAEYLPDEPPPQGRGTQNPVPRSAG